MNINISVEELKSVLYAILRLRKITDEQADFIVNDYIEAELDGHASHGVAKLLLLDSALKQKTGEPEVVFQKGNFAKINGNRNLGHISGLLAVNTALNLAKDNMNSIVAMTNSSRYSRVKPFAEKIAKAGFIGIVMNNGGPAAVTPFGSSTPIFGTNPICFSFPSSNTHPYVFDFSTSKKVWGEIRQAMLEGKSLPSECFLDNNGKFTTDPNLAEAVLPFGNEKGYALCYAIEILTGAFVSAKMGLSSSDEYDLGFLFMALSPEMFTSLSTFTKSVDCLAKEVSSSKPLSNTQRVYIPGERSKAQFDCNFKTGMLTIDNDIFNRLKQMSVSLDGGIESNTKVN